VSDAATVTVNVTEATNQQATITLVGGDVNLTFWGVPGSSYTVQFSTNLNAGIGWVDLTPAVTATNSPLGQISFTDTNAPSSGDGFYRLKP
jgi:hypothetical protein